MVISPEVRSFLAKYVDSAELLDILMLLHREPDGHWSAATVSSKVFTVPQAAERRLEELQARGLAIQDPERPGAYRLKVEDASAARAIEALRAVYDNNRAAVINAVFTMKSDPIKSFSDAFKLRGDA